MISSMFVSISFVLFLFFVFNFSFLFFQYYDPTLGEFCIVSLRYA